MGSLNWGERTCKENVSQKKGTRRDDSESEPHVATIKGRQHEPSGIIMNSLLDTYTSPFLLHTSHAGWEEYAPHPGFAFTLLMVSDDVTLRVMILLVRALIKICMPLHRCKTR